MSSDDRLREVLDRQAITEVIYRYCECFDRNDPEGVAALFTDNAVVDYNPDTPDIIGRDIAATIAIGLRDTFEATSHHVTNVLISFDGADQASSMCYVDAWHRYHGDRPDGFLWGRYHHTFIRRSGDWLITSLRLEAAGTIDFHRARMHGIGRR